MITVSGALSSDDVKDYHKEEWSQGDYYVSETETVAGFWFGKAAERLGLSGRIEKEDFFALADGTTREGRELVRAAKGENRVHRRAAHDFTANAPKGWSILFEAGGDARILEWHLEGVEAAFRVLEGNAQVRGGGAKRNRDLPSREIAAAFFTHHESRELDPHLHTHGVVFNLTWSPYANSGKGDFRALQTKGMFERRGLATQAYRAVLARRAVEGGYKIHIDEEGAPQPVGIDKAMIDGFSRRNVEIDRRTAEEVEKARERGKFFTSEGLKQLRKEIALLTRPKKQKDVDREMLRADWRERAAALGIDLDALIARAHANANETSVGDDAETLNAVRKSVDFAVEDLLERNAVVKESEIGATALSHHQFYGLVTLDDVQGELNRRVDAGELLREETPDGDWKYTTPALQQMEREFLGAITRGKGKVVPIGDMETAVPESERPDENGNTLSDEQKDVFLFLTQNTNQFSAVHGVAGAGKSFALLRFNEYARSFGYDVRFFAPTIPASDNLRKDGLPAETLQAHLKRSFSDARPSERQEVWVVDEAGLIGNEDFWKLIVSAKERYARVYLIGDTRQFPSVPAGRAFRLALDSGMPKVEMDKIIRQRNAPDEVRKAVELFKDGNVPEAFRLLKEKGRIIEADRNEQNEAIIDSLPAKLAEHYVRTEGTVKVVTATNEERKIVNAAIRSALKQQGRVGESGYQTVVHLNRNVTKARRKVAGNYEIGDRIRFEKLRHPDLEKGVWYEVTERNLKENTLTVSDGEGRTITYDPAEHYGIEDVYAVEDREFAVGDLIQFRGRIDSAGVKSGDVGKIVAVDSEGRALIEWKGKVIGLELSEFRTLDYAYASTGHSAQGLTVDTVLVLSTSRHREEVVNLASIFTNTSRTRDQLFVFVDEYSRAVAAASRAYSKDAALDLGGNPGEQEKVRLAREIVEFRNRLHALGKAGKVTDESAYIEGLMKKDQSILRKERNKQAERVELLTERARKSEEEGDDWAVLNAEAETTWKSLGEAEKEHWLNLARFRTGDLKDLDAEAESMFKGFWISQKEAPGEQTEFAEKVLESPLGGGKDSVSEDGKARLSLSGKEFHEREILGQKLALELKVRHLASVREAMVSQFEMRRFLVAEEKRDRSRFDIESQARIKAKLEIERIGMKGSDKREFREGFIKGEREASIAAFGQIDKGFAKSIARLEAAIDRHQGALNSILPLAEKMCFDHERAGTEVPPVFLDRRSLDALHEEAVDRRDVETVARLNEIRIGQAEELDRPAHTPESAGRVTAQKRIAEIEVKLAEERLSGFEGGFAFWSWKVGGEEWSLAEIERELLGARAGAKHQDSVERIGKLEEIKSEVETRIAEARSDLSEDLNARRSMRDVLQGMSVGFGEAVEPLFTGSELVRIEAAAMRLADPRLLGEYEQEAERFRMNENEKRTPFSRIETADLEGRAKAREIVARVEVEKSWDRLSRFDEAAILEDFASKMLSRDNRRSFEERETLGKQVILNLQLRDLQQRRDALIEQRDLRRFAAENESAVRETSVWDLERRAKARARQSVDEEKLTGAERKTEFEKAVASDLDRQRETTAAVEQEFSTRLKELDAAVELFNLKATEAGIQADEIRSRYREGGEELPRPYLGRSTLDELSEKAFANRDVERLVFLETIRSRQAEEFGVEKRTSETSERLEGQIEAARMDLSSAQSRMNRFEDGKNHWTWRTSDGREWSINEIDRALLSKEWELRGLNVTANHMARELDDKVLFRGGAEREFSSFIGERGKVAEELEKLRAVREELTVKVEETRGELTGEIEKAAGMVSTLVSFREDTELKVEPRMTGYELARMEQAAMTSKDSGLLERYEAEARRFAARENELRNAESGIDLADLAARAGARVELAALDLVKSRADLERFHEFRGKTRVELADGTAASLAGLRNRSPENRLRIAFSTALEGRIQYTGEESLRGRVEKRLIERVAGVLNKAKEGLERRDGFLFDFGVKVIERVSSEFKETPELAARRLQIEKALDGRERKLAETVGRNFEFHKSAKAVQERYAAELGAEGRIVPAPLFTTGESSRLELEGIRRGDLRLEQQGIENALLAFELKEKLGSVHPLQRPGEYLLDPKGKGIEYAPIERYHRYSEAKDRTVNAERFQDAAKSVSERYEADRGALDAPRPLFTAGESVKIEHHGLAFQQDEMRRLGVDAAMQALKLKNEVGSIHPLTRKSEYDGRETVSKVSQLETRMSVASNVVKEQGVKRDEIVRSELSRTNRTGSRGFGI